MTQKCGQCSAQTLQSGGIRALHTKGVNMSMTVPEVEK